MGEERDELMFAMYLAARDNALEHLSREVLEMVEDASRHTGLAVEDAWAEARATSPSPSTTKTCSRRSWRGSC